MNGTVGYSDYRRLIDKFGEMLDRKLGGNLVSIVLFGSVARGTARSDSDIDLLVIARNASSIYHQRLNPVLKIIRKLRKGVAWEKLEKQGLNPYLNVLVFSVEEARENRYIFLDMVAEAVLIIDEGGFFAGRLKAIQERLKELGAERIQSIGGWYWDLKPDLVPGEVVEF